VTRKSTGQVVGAWVQSGMVAGLAIGGGYGTLVGLSFGLIGLVFGLFIGALVGPFAGAAVGLFDGLLLAWLRPARGHAPLAAALCTELILAPVQAWLWLLLHAAVALSLVGVPSVAGLGVAAELGRRLPPGGGQPPA
jgi:hypothetical protein